MAFTQQTLFHRYMNADGTPAAGSIEFTLSEAMSNGGITITPGSHISAPLDASGNVSSVANASAAVLTSTQDPGTQSQGVPTWRCDERISGAPVRTWFFELPPGPATVDLQTYMPSNNPLQAGAPIEAG